MRQGYTEEQFARLPKWAREEISYWERQATRYRTRLEELEADFPDSNVKVSKMPPYKDQGLPMDSEIDFYLGDSREKYHHMITVQHLRTKNREVLRVTSQSGTLTIKPGGGCNVIELTTEAY